MTISQESVIKEYQTGTPDTRGSPGNFSTEELQKLAELWSLVLDYLAANKDKQIPVNSELLQQASHDWSALGPDNEISDSEDCEETTRRAWKFTKGEAGIRKLGSWGRKPKADQQRLMLDRYVNETTQEHIDRRTGHYVPLLPEKYIPSFKYPDSSTRNLREVFWRLASAKQHPDIWLHRMLRSNSWDVNKAMDAIQWVVDWRATQAVDRVNWEGDVNLGLDELRLGISELVGVDRLGCPLMYVRVRRIMPRANQSFVLKRFLVHQFEALQFVTRKCTRISMLYDFTGFSMDNTPFHIVHFLVTMGIRQYAETTSVLILLVDSWLFANFWNLVRPFLDANLSARIVFAKSIDDVRVFVDDRQIPEEVGGSNRFQAVFKLPEINENSQLFDATRREVAEEAWWERVRGFEEATRKWCARYSGNVSDEYAERRDQAAQELDRAERQLSRFTRARNIFERLGVVDAASGCLRLPDAPQ
ncbi:phosphatidylinositol transfer protein csr1 [Coemansia sp. RSA 2711]|nr:phosphatidylinositol transfer protein csr1 [Coemansia sp. RSA 2711]